MSHHPSPSLITFDQSPPRNLLDDEDLGPAPLSPAARHTSESGLTSTVKEQVDEQSFVPSTPRPRTRARARAASVPRTPEPLVIATCPEEIDLSSFSLDLEYEPTSATSAFYSPPPSPLEHLPGFSSPITSRSPSPRSHTPHFDELSYYRVKSPCPPPSPVEATPFLTPDSDSPDDRIRQPPSPSPEPEAGLSSQLIIISTPKEVAAFFDYPYVRFPFPTLDQDTAAGEDYQLPPDIARLIEIASDSDSDDEGIYEARITGGQRPRNFLEEHVGQPMNSAMGSSADRLNGFASVEAEGSRPTSASGSKTQLYPFDQASVGGSSAPISPYQLLSSTPSPRLNIPPNLLGTNDALQRTIMQSWKETEPSDSSKDYCIKFLARLTDIINARFGGRASKRFQVDVFGSVSWGGETGKSGDLDLVILDRELPQGYHPSLWRLPPDIKLTPSKATNSHSRIPTRIEGLPGVYHTYTLARCLRDAGMREVIPIPAANTPIVKFVDPSSSMQCDINVNDLGGWYNSSLILHYCRISPHLLRPMIHTLKLWAAAFYVNDASGSKGTPTMSSYCLTLMAIAYLQHRDCLPNLQADVQDPTSGGSDLNNIWVAWSREQGVPAHVAFNRDPPAHWQTQEPELTVAEAIRGFFAYFTLRQTSKDKEWFDCNTKMISILQGGVVSRAQAYGQARAEEMQFDEDLRNRGWPMAMMQTAKAAWKNKRMEEEAAMGKGDQGVQPKRWTESRLVVQDPFLWQKNCAGMMSFAGLSRWQDAIDKAHHLCEAKGKALTVVELLFNPNPPEIRTPRRGRGGGNSSGRGSPAGSSRASSTSARSRGRGGRTLRSS